MTGQNLVHSGDKRYCNRCIYNRYIATSSVSPYPCGQKYCKPVLESNTKNETVKMQRQFERRRTANPRRKIIEEPVDMGNGYIHTSRPKVVNKKISEREVVKMSDVKQQEEQKAPEQPKVAPVTNEPQAVGVDVGTAFIVSARYDKNQQIDTISVRDGFYKIEATKQKRNMLQSSNVNYIKQGDDLFVVGNEAFDMAVLFEEKLRRPLRSGVLSADEKECEPIVMEILKQVVGKGKTSDFVYYSVPADPVDSNFDVIYHEAKFKSFFSQLGFNAENVYPLNEAMAIVNSELADTMFTGMAISFGAGMTNVAMAYRGLEIFSFSVARGGDWIDHEVSHNRQISQSDATATKESQDFNLLKANDVIEDAISIFYGAHLDYVGKFIADNLEHHKRKIKLREPLKVVVSGGTSKPKGFIELFKRQIEKKPWNIPIGEIVHATNPLDAVARGCLIAAQRDLLDSQEG